MIARLTTGFALSAAMLLSLGLSPSYAMGSGEGARTEQPNRCASGEVYDQAARKCVKKSS